MNAKCATKMRQIAVWLSNSDIQNHTMESGNFGPGGNRNGIPSNLNFSHNLTWDIYKYIVYCTPSLGYKTPHVTIPHWIGMYRIWGVGVMCGILYRHNVH